MILGSLATVDPATLSGTALDSYRTAETRVVVGTYLGLAAALLVVASGWSRRKRLVESHAQATSIIHALTC